MVVTTDKRIMLIYTSVDDEPIKVPVDENTTAEDVCIKVSKYLNIGPVARHLFALRLYDKNVYLSQNCKLSQLRFNVCVFRLRFKVPDLKRLEEVDVNAYNYLFHQARGELVKSQVPDISYNKHKKEVVGLGITDMYRLMLEKGVGKAEVANHYKHFFPKDIVLHHWFFLKNPIYKHLSEIEQSNLDPSYVKRLWMDQFREMAPTYLTEEYMVLCEEGGHCCGLCLRVDPFHKEFPGVQIRPDGKKNWTQLCSIDDLCFVSARNDNTVEISRKNGIPSYLKFPSIPLMISFVSLLDGYYRLMVKWTFNLCKEIPTPSLNRLYSLKCHGPVGGEFSYAKLEEKRSNQVGCFILRESELHYDTYYLDVCCQDSAKPKTYKIEAEVKEEDGQEKLVHVFSADGVSYSSIPDLIAAYRVKGASVWLQECLPPSEYDESRLLLCKLSNNSSDDQSGAASTLAALLTAPPQIIDTRTLQVYKSRKQEGRGSMCTVYRSMWKAGKGKKVIAAVKMLKADFREKHLQEFLDLGSRWSSLKSPSVVRMLGMTLVNPVSMVMEYVPLGPLDVYLHENRSTIQPVDLVEASTNLATALWHLEEHGVVHGNIRCRKLLVANHDENSFVVRLADPGLHSYTAHDIHWISPECYHNLESARVTASADVWAFGTTMWEIFAYGDAIPENSNMDAVMKHYQMGWKLPSPPKCTPDIYQLILECWEVDPHRRKRPQAIMRDINQILYQVFNSRRTHSYSVAFPKLFKEQAADTCSISDSEISLLSGATVETVLDSSDQLVSLSGADQMSHSEGSSLHSNWMLGDSREQLLTPYETMTSDISAMLSKFNFSNATASLESMTSVFELGPDVNVVLQGRIGQGFYGEVFKGTLERMDCEPEMVAVKKLKTNALGTTLQDFEREINIMKTLEHPNIVQIKGVVQDPEISLVMEFVQHGSLQSYLKIHREKLSPEKHLLKFALDVARGMEYLGMKNIVHRDLAARNILVVDENNVKISDFGLAQVMGQNDYYILKTNRELPIKWYAPESLRDGKFSPRSDVWSYGVTLYEMFSLGEEPRLSACGNDQDHQELLKVLESGARLPCPPNCPQEIYVKLMAPCWEAESKERPSFTEICSVIENFPGSF